ncbi:MAG TPA: hypothetical protein VE907_06565 [Gammaproteobacteria bacterium]|nr:hypothetical protein [Gammaproteobacteria bacterium]
MNTSTRAPLLRLLRATAVLLPPALDPALTVEQPRARWAAACEET